MKNFMDAYGSNDKTLTGQTNIDRSQSTRQTGSHNSQARWFALSNQFGMTQSGTRQLSRHSELVSESLTVADCNNCEVALTGKTSSVTLNLFQGLLPSRYDDNRETSPTGQTNIDRSQSTRQTGSHNSQARWFALSNQFGMTSRLWQGRKSAFTLAEVLITLGIIGVVAAMTLPTLVHKIEQKILVSQFKKMYANLNIALQATVFQDNDGNAYPCYMQSGSKGEYSCTQFYNDFTKQLKIIKTETITYLPYKDGSEVQAEGGILTFDNTDFYGNGGEGYYKYYLADGSVFYRSKIYYYVHPAQIIVDVNGDKAPNRWGYDVHGLVLLRNQINNNITYIIYDNVIEKGGMSAKDIIKK